MAEKLTTSWRLIDVRLPRDVNWWQLFYGTDIFVNGVPLLKVFALLIVLAVVLVRVWR